MMMALALLSVSTPALPVACPPEIVEADRQFVGIYVDAFEGQRFFEGAKTLADLNFRARPKIWFSPDIVGLGESYGIKRRYPGHAYRMTFRGRKRFRQNDGSNLAVPCGYGHFDASDGHIELLKLEAIEFLGPVR